MNWIDWLLIIFILFSAASGFAEGFVRMVIGFGALIAGFLCASWFHGVAGGWVEPYVESRAAASVVGFSLILVSMLVLGWLTGVIVQRMFRLVGLSWLDRLIGGAFGAARAVLILAIAAIVLTTFAPGRLPKALSGSELAPYVLGASKVISTVTPYELKSGFARAYDEFRNLVRGIKATKRLPAREE